MASPTISSVSKDIKALHVKLDDLVASGVTDVSKLAWWKAHSGWLVACVACFVLGLLF